MNNTMISIGKYIAAHYASFGLAAAGDLITIEKPKETLANGSKKLIMLPLRTAPDHSHKVPFSNLILPGVKAERFLTMVEFECKTRAQNPGQDFYWNTARQFRDKLYNALAGTNRGGITIPRYDWTDPQKPVAAGEIFFEVDTDQGTPIEDPLEDQNDPANKSIFLTYKVHWWSPIH